MTPENRPQTPAKQEIHPGIIPVERGGERPIDDSAPSIENLDTDGINILLPESPYDGFESLPPTAAERVAFDQDRAAVRDRYESPEAPVAPRKNGKLYAILGGAAATAVAATALFLLPKGENNSDENKPTPNETVATAPVAPVETASPAPVETVAPAPSAEVTNSAEKPLSVEALEIDASLTDLELATEFTDRISQWQMQGTTPETFKNRDRSMDLPLWATQIAKQYSPVFAEALYGRGWKSNPDIAEEVNQTTKNNAINLELYVRTFDPQLNPQNKERIKVTTTMTGLVETMKHSDGSRVLIFETMTTNNSLKNIVPDQPTSYGIWTIKVVEVEGKAKIAAFSAVTDKTK